MKKVEIITDYEREAIRRRLACVRFLKAGNNKTEFARMLGIIPSRWKNFERGCPLTMTMAWMLIKYVDGLTISYLANGMKEGMDPALLEELERIHEDLFPTDKTLNERKNMEERVRILRRQAAELETKLRGPASKSGKTQRQARPS